MPDLIGRQMFDNYVKQYRPCLFKDAFVRYTTGIKRRKSKGHTVRCCSTRNYYPKE